VVDGSAVPFPDGRNPARGRYASAASRADDRDDWLEGGHVTRCTLHLALGMLLRPTADNIKPSIAVQLKATARNAMPTADAVNVKRPDPPLLSQHASGTACAGRSRSAHASAGRHAA